MSGRGDRVTLQDPPMPNRETPMETATRFRVTEALTRLASDQIRNVRVTGGTDRDDRFSRRPGDGELVGERASNAGVKERRGHVAVHDRGEWRSDRRRVDVALDIQERLNRVKRGDLLIGQSDQNKPAITLALHALVAVEPLNSEIALPFAGVARDSLLH